MTSVSTLWSRFGLCIISVAFLLFYSSQKQQFSSIIAQLTWKFDQAYRNSEALVTQLQVMIDRHKRLEKLMQETDRNYSRILSDISKRYKTVNDDKSSCLKELEQCNDNLNLKIDQLDVPDFTTLDLQRDMKFLKGNRTLAEESFSIAMKENSKCRTDMEQCRRELQIAKSRPLCSTQRNKSTVTIPSLTSVVSMMSTTPYYVHHDHIHFNRRKPADNDLEFNRQVITSKPIMQLPLIPNNVLLLEFAKRKSAHGNRKQNEKDDGNASVIEIVDVADLNEADYKEMH